MDRLPDENSPILDRLPDDKSPMKVRRSVRRRLVQGTLFPHKPRDPQTENGEEKNEDGKNEEEEAEMCGSLSKKRRARKGKSTPQAKAPKKLKEKSPAKRTPKKNAATSNGQADVNSGEKEDLTPPPMPNLRLEAKLTAEENSQRFAGKQIHPFFTSMKVGKRGQETTELQNDCCLVQRADKTVTIGPIHVFERDQDDAIALDWRDWRLVEKPFVNGCCCQESPFSSSLEESVGIGKIFSVPYPSGESLMETVGSDQHYQAKRFHEASMTVSAMPSGLPVACDHHVEDANMEWEVVEGGFSNGYTRKSEAEQRSECLQERNISHYNAHAVQPDERLWTDKYQPRRAMDVCGNSEPVRFFKEWLQNWHQGSHHSCIDLYVGDKCAMKDADYNGFQTDSDSENIDGETSLKNVLLITGPVGSGKSAAIYACAKEQGFKILEISASEIRSGAVVKQKFGEALESHSLEWTQESLTGSQCGNIAKFPKVLDGKSDNEVVEVIPIPDVDHSVGATLSPGKFVSHDGSNVSIHGQLKPLILFEDVDVMFPEDRGFSAAIQQIAEKAKGPVILTSNNIQPTLPENMDRLEVCFTMPSKEELLQHINMVCSLEKANIQPCFLEQLVHYCQGDIRKTIMHLQFWCQGNQFCKGGEGQKPAVPLLFDPEAGHQLLPKLIPWDFPSQLSELVEKEIAASLAMLKDSSVSMDATKEDIGIKEMRVFETDSIQAKKEAMLSRNCSDHDCNHFLTPDVTCDYFNSSNTPVSFSRQKSRRNLNVVLSSDSEDELVHDRCPSTSDNDNGLPHEVDGELPLECPGVQNCLNTSTSMQLCVGSHNLKEDICQCSETATELDVKESCKSVDVSCVPESSVVAETEINNATYVLHSRLSSDEVTNTLEEVSVSYEYEQNLLPVEVDSLKSTPTSKKDSAIFGAVSVSIAVSPHEEVEDSQHHHVEAVIREFQVMDQCSRVDFNCKLEPVEECGSSRVTDLVQESWRKLRDHVDLRHLVSLEGKDVSRIIQIAYNLSNLISETELLLSKCQLLDVFNLSTVLPEGTEAFTVSDKHLQMPSIIAQHGFCLYAKEAAAAGLKMHCEGGLSFNWEMFATNNFLEIDGFAERNLPNRSTLNADEMSQLKIGKTVSSERESRLFNTIQSLVHPRMYMTLKGNALHEYLSSLSCISRTEVCRLSESKNRSKGWRRGRAPRSYLSAASLMLSPEEITLLCQSNLYGKSSFQNSDDTDIG